MYRFGSGSFGKGGAGGVVLALGELKKVGKVGLLWL